VVERFAPLPGRVDRDREITAQLILAHEFVEAARPKCAVELRLLAGLCFAACPVLP
jgi:hypothetical protein